MAQPRAAPVSREAAQRYWLLYDAMSEAVRKHLGLRGYFMQLRIERCRARQGQVASAGRALAAGYAWP
ncbi:hypothetical protein KHF85_04520 [Xanthomonas translucens pv. graminis]|uniref:hypothetical protein n=1 Tax=Xanthomonas graminis TaxID=3390026 RepID=UPI0025413EC4|nr:hypothetical protein [Xanthomonas translucens]WIH07046.1 hypothetical protein KHF85_04520 [Xanthomonas translucens pv. graminis]